MPNLIDLKGMVFGEYTVLEYKGNCFWLCRCSCKTEKLINGRDLRDGTAGKSCGCIKKPRWHMPGYSEFTIYLHHITSRITSGKKCEINITVEDLGKQWESQRGLCPFTGKPMLHMLPKPTGPKNPYQASVDRIDPSKGYIKTNIRFISMIANYAKHLFSDKDVIEFCRLFVKNHKTINTPSNRSLLVPHTHAHDSPPYVSIYL
jgi:hypothetical protein